MKHVYVINVTIPCVVNSHILKTHVVYHITVVNSQMVSEGYTRAENSSDEGTCGLQTVPHISDVKM